MMELVQTITVFAAQNGGEGGEGGQGAAGFSFFIPMILILVVFFWLTNRSQKKKKQEREELIESIQAKDDVITIGGIHGRVMSVGEDTVELRVDRQNDIRITMNKSAIAGRAGEEDEEA